MTDLRAEIEAVWAGKDCPKDPELSKVCQEDVGCLPCQRKRIRAILGDYERTRGITPSDR